MKIRIGPAALPRTYGLRIGIFHSISIPVREVSWPTLSWRNSDRITISEADLKLGLTTIYHLVWTDMIGRPGVHTLKEGRSLDGGRVGPETKKRSTLTCSRRGLTMVTMGGRPTHQLARFAISCSATLCHNSRLAGGGWRSSAL